MGDRTSAVASERLLELGVDLPAAPAPVGAYLPAIKYGDLIQTTGQLPFVDGQLIATGLVGTDLDVAAGRAAARIAVLNAVSAAAELAGGVDRIRRVVALTGHIACAAGFTQHSEVMNGASETLVEIFGDAGRHVRTNVGASALPMGSPVEIELLCVAG
jgi:enamine deaminase RidA (YjgF/YER057c/UK114 family)